METITIILRSAPCGDERIWNAFRLARALTTAAVNMKVNIFLTGDAVTTQKRSKTSRELLQPRKNAERTDWTRH